MNVTYEHKPAMTFIGYSTSIRPEEGGQRDQAMPFQLKHSIRPLQRYAAGE